jgi:DNA-binding winged helix-turn-helix (wHTH) protein
MLTDDFDNFTGPEIAFGPFRFYPESYVLMRAGAPIALGSRAREILRVLVEHAGETVTKRELMNRTWPHTLVAEGALRVHIAALRKALGEGEGPTRYLQNDFGHGYRLVAECRVQNSEVSTNDTNMPATAPAESDFTHRF